MSQTEYDDLRLRNILPELVGQCEVTSVIPASTWNAGETCPIDVTVGWSFKTFRQDVRCSNVYNLPVVAYADFTWNQNLNITLHYQIENEAEQVVTSYFGGTVMQSSKVIRVLIPASYRIGKKTITFWAEANAAYNKTNVGCAYTQLPGYSYKFWHADRFNWTETQTECWCRGTNGICGVLLHTIHQEEASVIIGVTLPTAKYTSYFADGNIAPAVVNFNASSSVPGDASITSYKWEWGDSTPATTQPLSSAQHVYTLPGSYQCKLTVTTAIGSHSVTHTISVNSEVPIPKFARQEDAEGHGSGETYCSWAPGVFELGDTVRLALWIINQGAACTVSINYNLGMAAQIPLISGIAVPAYNEASPTRVNLPTRTIDFFLGDQTDPGLYTVFFHLIYNNIETDEINFGFVLQSGVITHDCPTGTVWSESQQKCVEIHDCADGYIWDDAKQACVLEDEKKTGLPGWLIPVAIGAGGLVILALVKLTGRKK